LFGKRKDERTKFYYQNLPRAVTPGRGGRGGEGEGQHWNKENPHLTRRKERLGNRLRDLVSCSTVIPACTQLGKRKTPSPVVVGRKRNSAKDQE